MGVFVCGSASGTSPMCVCMRSAYGPRAPSAHTHQGPTIVPGKIHGANHQRARACGKRIMRHTHTLPTRASSLLARKRS
eukprot:6042767-Prymnesium_polylepis.1